MTGRVRQRLVEIIAGRPDGIARDELMDTLYADDIDGGAETLNTISVLIFHANR